MKPPQLSPAGRPSLLIVEDDIILLQTLAIFLGRCGFHVTPTASLREAQTRFWSRQDWAAIVSDHELPDGTGLDFCAWVQAQSAAIPPFLITSGGSKPDGIVGVEFLAKPFALAQLEARIRALLPTESTRAGLG